MQNEINQLAEQCGVNPIELEIMARSVACKLQPDFTMDEMCDHVREQSRIHSEMSLAVLEAHAEREACHLESVGKRPALSLKAMQYEDFQRSIVKLLKA